MLPWRRSKFVLVEDEAKAKPKSLGAGLTYHSIFSALLRSCPDLLPDCPFDWLGSVFQTKRQKVELNREEPTYSVRYLGSVVTIAAKGDGCTREAVAKIWTRSDYGEQSAKMRLAVAPQGIRMSADKHGKKNPAHLYSLSRITYCAADPCRPKILAWVYRHQVKNKAVVLRCHAALVTRSEKARAIARSFYQTSASAFSEFKRLKRQSDVRHCRQQLLGEEAVPVMPRRRLLNGQCHYRPPADNPGALPHLCSITEEEEEEEEEEESGEEEKEEEGKEFRCEERQESKTKREDREEKGEEEEDGEERNHETFTDSVRLCKMDLGELISGLTECQINIISDSNNNTMTFISTLV